MKDFSIYNMAARCHCVFYKLSEFDSLVLQKMKPIKSHSRNNWAPTSHVGRSTRNKLTTSHLLLPLQVERRRIKSKKKAIGWINNNLNKLLAEIWCRFHSAHIVHVVRFEALGVPPQVLLLSVSKQLILSPPSLLFVPGKQRLTGKRVSRQSSTRHDGMTFLGDLVEKVALR